jgi:5-carboxymethyl-2-hydroxymuconate isomerase
MPHCILEHSANVLDPVEMREVLLDVNRALIATGAFTPGDIKSRAVRHEEVVIGDGEPDRSFVTLNVQILVGRSEEFRTDLSRELLAVLERHFPRTLAGTRCSLTVQVNEMERASYLRRRTYDP